MQIKGNEYLIDNITEMIKNGSNKNANTFDKCIEIYLEEGRRYNSNNASIEKRRATTGNDGIHHSEQGQYRWTNGNEKNVRNRGQSTTNYSKSSIVDNRQAARDIGQNELMMEI